MAVVQISRIQVRRGQKNVTGMPQLASGEIAWAVDTQELYIGNGSVYEGSPNVGNTKILTQNDLTIQGNLLNLLQHIYKVNDSIQTGPSVNNPVSRTVQDRLDDRVTFADFVPAESYQTASYDYTSDLQRAIDQLFYNAAAKSYESNDGAIASRVTLEIPAGRYIVTDTIVVPSYATIVGAGSGKTIIECQSDVSILAFKYDNINDPEPDTESQTKFVTLKGLTLRTTVEDQIGVDMYAVRDSHFEDLIIEGVQGTDNNNSIGIKMSSPLSVVTCERNFFKNVIVTGLTYGVYSANDIRDNTFTNCYLHGVTQGFSLGFGLIGGSGYPLGERFGPRQTTIENCTFAAIKKYAVYVGLGSGNTVRDCKLTEVGDDGGGITGTLYPQIYFKNQGNSAERNNSDRAGQLTSDTYQTTPYIPEVTGQGMATSYGNISVTLGSSTSPSIAFRLPVVTDSGGLPKGSVVYVLDYIYQSTQNSYTRRGTLTISADLNNVYGQLSDDYEYAGPLDDETLEDASTLDFSLEFRNSAGNAVAMGSASTVYAIAVKYTNTADAGHLTYTYKSAFSNLAS